MKRFALLFAATALTACAWTRPSYQASIGPIAPQGDFAAGTNTGLIISGGLTAPIANHPGLVFEGQAFYGHVGYSGSAGDATNIPGVSAGARYEIGTGSTKPYVSGAAGILQHRYDAGSSGYDYGSDAETKPFVSVGGGLSFGRVVIDARLVGASGTAFIPLTVGFRFGGPSK